MRPGAGVPGQQAATDRGIDGVFAAGARTPVGGCPVGAGLPANGPGLLANLHQTFTVAATTVFAGKPAPAH
ncbi:hypothetical protein DBL03_15240 [Pseudomonas putida]|nr:hypothetical protein DBL03_15240 [Pseudomonas putida]